MSFGVFCTGTVSLLRQPIHRSTAVQGLAPAHALHFRRQHRSINPQPAGLPIAVIDGPFDADVLSKILTRRPMSFGNGSCRADTNGACSHGTFIMGVIGASENAPIRGRCPECQLLHVQLFVDDEETPSATIGRLAEAITVAVAAGAKLINLSLAIQGGDAASDPALARALDHAEARDTVIMVAAGNEGRRATGQLLSHPVTIPVVAIDAANQLLPGCNFGPTIFARGIAAIGHQVRGYAPGGGDAVMSGTSVATAVATGTLAQLWSECRNATGKQVRAAVAGLTPRDGPLPPTLDRESFLAELDRIIAASAASVLPTSHSKTNYLNLQGKTTMTLGNGLPRTDAPAPAATSAQPVTPANGSGCMCGAPGGTCTCADAGPSNFVYVLGTVDVKFPDQSISAEFQRWIDEKGVAGLQPLPDEHLRHWYWRILTMYPNETRYIARQFCWILRVEGEPAYYLRLRDMFDFTDLIRCLEEPWGDDLCLFVGSSSLQLVEMSHGINAPVLTVDQVSPFKKSDMLKKFIPTETIPPEKETLKSSTKKGKRKGSAENDVPEPDDELYKLYGELYKQLFQSADNFGHTDEWRALNFLAAGGHPPVFQLCSALAHKGCYLTAFPALTSRLSAWGNKRIVDAIFTFGRAAEMEKFFVRVDVTHLFPILVSKIARYVDRVNL